MNSTENELSDKGSLRTFALKLLFVLTSAWGTAICLVPFVGFPNPYSIILPFCIFLFLFSFWSAYRLWKVSGPGWHIVIMLVVIWDILLLSNCFYRLPYVIAELPYQKAIQLQHEADYAEVKGDNAKALKIYLEIAEKYPAEFCERTGHRIYLRIADLYKEKVELDKAKEWYQKDLDYITKAFGEVSDYRNPPLTGLGEIEKLEKLK